MGERRGQSLPELLTSDVRNTPKDRNLPRLIWSKNSLPQTKLDRSQNGSQLHWVFRESTFSSTRLLPKNFRNFHLLLRWRRTSFLTSTLFICMWLSDLPFRPITLWNLLFLNLCYDVHCPWDLPVCVWVPS